MRISEARHKANQKWNNANLERIGLTVRMGRKAVIKAAADAQGESLNGFITAAINERMERLAAASQSGVE